MNKRILVLLLAAVAVVVVLFYESIGRFFKWLSVKLFGGFSMGKRRGVQ